MAIYKKTSKMCFTNNRLTADKTWLGSTRLCRVQLKNKVKLLLCKFDRGHYGGFCGKGDQRVPQKKNNYFGGLGGLVGLVGWGGRGGREGQD